MMKSRHLSSGFAINSVCFLLLINVYFISTVVKSELCTLSNWIEQSKGKWPNGGSSEPFLVFHSEYENSKLFGLNKSLRNENWLNDPDLSFKYWVSELTYFRSRKETRSLPERDLKLIPDTNGWKSFDDSEKNLKYSLKSISKEQWDGFGFENSDIFTMGLKDVSVKFVEKIDTNQENLYTAYPTDATGFKLINFVTKKPTIGGEGAPAISNNDVIPDDNAKTIIFNGKNIEKIEKLSEWKFKKFLFSYKKDGTNDKQSVTITVKNDNTCTITEQLSYAQIFKNSKCANGFIDTLQIEKTDKFEMSDIKGFLDASKAAFVSKLPSEYTKKLYKNSPPLTTTGKTYYINSTTILETKYTQVKGYIQLNEVRPPISDTINAPKDTCYLITKNGHAASSVDVYLTLPDKKVGFKLDTVIDTKQICLFDYVALQNIDKYMITLIAYGEVTQDFNIIVDTKYEKLAEKFLFVPDGTIKLDSLNWFYNNPIFENVVTTNDPEPKLLMICDVLSSCYPLKPTENDPSNYALPLELKNVLDSSPFFQIRGSIKNDKTISFAKITTDQAHETFNRDFIKENAQFLTEISKTATQRQLNKPGDYQLIFDENKQLKIDFSLKAIDMRFQKLKINIELINQADGSLADKTKNELLLDSFTLNKGSNEWSFPISTLPSAKISLNTFSTATDELFSLRPTQYLTESKITLQLKLENSEPSAKGLLTKIKFTVLPLGTQKLETKIISPESLILKGKQSNEDIGVVPAQGVSQGFSIDSHKTRFFLTEFIENAGLTKLGQTELKMDFKITSPADTKLEDYIVYRVIVDQQNLQFELVPGKFLNQNNKRDVKFSDTVTEDDKTPVSGRFRVLYIVHSNNKDKIKNVKIEKFSVKGKETTDTNNVKATQLLAHVNLKYEPAVCYKTELNNNVCPLPNNINQITEIKCDMAVGCSNIFDLQLPISAMEPTVPTEKKFRFVPFKLASGKREDHQLIIKRKDLTSAPKPDFCVKFSYLAKTTALFVTDDSDNQNTIKLPLTLDSENFNNLKSNFKVCASHFTENVDSVNSFVFYFEHHELDIDNHFVQIETDDLNKQTGFSNIILPTGIYINNLDKSQFLEISNNWNPEFDKTTMFKNKLTFQLKSDNLEVLEANGKNGTNEFYYETLRSKWIKMPVEGASLKYGLTFNNALSKNNNSIVVNENTIVRIISSRTASKSNQLNSFKTDAVTTLEKALPPISDNNKKLTNEHYRLEIELVLDVTKKNALKKNNKLIKDDLVLVIENLNINDPCIVGGAVSTLQKCHPIKNKQNIEIGLEDPATAYNWCERGYNSSIFGPICHCNKNYTGDTCENENYCKTQGFAVCGEERLCKNDEEFKQIKCDCKRQEEKWNPFFKGCINPVDLTKCGENSRPQYTKNGVTCKCLDDYTEVIQNATKICVPFEPCNKEHRKLLKIKIPCPNANTICELTGSKTQENDFQCNCNTGFININGVRTTNAKCLPQVCKSCLGRCKSTGKDYICDKKLSCDQQPGYDYNSTSNECEFNGDKFAKLLGCAAGTTAEFGSDGNPACKCAEGQKLDLISRKCSETECNDKAVNACSSRGASKCTFNSGKAFCECKDTDVPYAEHLNGSDWKCISKCDLLEKPDLYEARCSNSFEHCNGKAIMQFAPLRSGSTTDNTDGTKNAVETPYIKNIFVYNFTSFSIPSTTNQKSHCACDLGFNWNSGKCFPSTIPTHTISNFEFDLIHTNDEAGYIENVRKTFVKLVAAVVVIKDKSSLASLNSATKCKKADEKSILCETSFQSSLTNEEITKKFAAACVPISTDKNKCFYVVNPTNTFFNNFLTRSAIDNNNFATFEAITNSPPKDSDSVLVHNPTINLKVTKEEYCSKNKNTCSNYAYSVCKDDGAKPFECLCPVKEKSFFKVIDSKKLSFIENGKTIDLQMETCGIHNMCKVDKNNFGCKSDDALCHFQVELDDVKKEYFGVSYCTCPTGATLSDRSLSCKESCNGFCSNNTASCGQDYLNTKKIICNCKDGFTGSKCEKKATEAKKEAEASSSKAYLISTIVVSVIAAIALIGLAVLYFKRR